MIPVGWILNPAIQMQLPSILRQLIPADITDAQEKRIARAVVTVLGPGAILLLVLGLLQPLMTPGGWLLGVVYGMLASPLLAAILLVHRGNIRAAGIFSISFLWAGVTLLAVFSEGIRSPSVVAYPVLVGAAAFFWTLRAAVAIAVVSSLVSLVMVLVQAFGFLPEPLREVTLFRAWGGVMACTVLAAIIMKVAMDMIRESVLEAQASERKFRDLVQGAPDGMLVLGADFTIREVNRRALSLLGGRREDLLGRSGESVIPGLREILLARPGQAQRGMATALTGEKLPVNISSNPVVSGKEHLQVVTLADISDQLRVEEAREQVEMRLREAQKMETVGQLAGGVAHDFNNLLTIVMGNVSLELERDDTSPEERARWGEVDAAAARAAELTQQLLAFSRQQILDPEPVNLADYLGEKVPLLQRVLGDQCRILLEAGGDDWIRVDPGQLDNVVLALVHNARDAMPEAGTLRIISRTISVQEDDPDHEEVPPGRYVHVCFQDTGTGMDSKSLERAFEPFFTTKGFGGGMGLGLATVHGIVTQSGGYVSVQSTPGVGSTFCLYLPALPHPEAGRA